MRPKDKEFLSCEYFHMTAIFFGVNTVHCIVSFKKIQKDFVILQEGETRLLGQKKQLCCRVIFSSKPPLQLL